MAITDTLASIPLFAGLRQPELEALAGRMRRRRYKENEAIFHRDDPGAALYVILSGRVKVSEKLIGKGIRRSPCIIGAK